MRVAFVSPLPPLSSGIADYSAELVPRLAAAGLELTLFHEGSTPSRELTSRFACLPVAGLASAAGGFDAVLYQLGNSAPHHAETYRALRGVPGVVVLHEFMLHHLVKALTLDTGDSAAYVEEMRYCAGESGRRAAQRLLDTHHPVDAWSYPLFERVVDRSLGVLVHSWFAAERVRRSRPHARVHVVPFPADVATLEPVDAATRSAARRQLGWADDEFVVGSFGFATPHKRLEVALEAFAELRHDRPASRLVICGEVSPHYDLAGRIAELGGAGVEITGRVPLERFHAAMRACDVALNLRHPTGGETSASLVRLLALGIPTVVTDAGSFAEIPDGAVAKLPLDELEGDLLAALLRRLADDGGLRERIGGAARRHALRAHDPAAAARAVRGALESIVAASARPVAPVPPLAPWDGIDPKMALLVGIGADWADLGGDEEDPALASVADDLVELGWAPEPAP